MLVTLVTNAFGQSWQPFSFSVMHQENAKRIYNNVMIIYSVVMILLCVFLSLFANEIIKIVASPKFLPSAPLIGIIAMAYFMNSLSIIAVTGMSILKNIRWYSPAVIIGCIVTALLTIILVPSFGRFGLAYSILGGFSVVPLILFYKSQKVYSIPYNFKVLVFLILFGMLVIVSNSYNHFHLLVKVGIALVFSIIVTSIILSVFKSRQFLFNLVKRKFDAN